MESCVPLVTTFLLLTMALGATWAQEEPSLTVPEEAPPQPSNIDSWNEEEDPLPTWFGMGFESRKSDSSKLGAKNSERIVNNW